MHLSHFLLGLSATLLVSCSGNKTAEQSVETDTPTNVDIKGRWYLENIVFSDSDYVRPADEVPGSRQYIVFDDSTYFINTNCNSISGYYTVTGDSITLSDGARTEMACDNMTTEDALVRILPTIATVYIENDSIARLDSRNPSQYILLRKCTPVVKCHAD
ncbi:MAG: META domain-containing protein [Duncaniella sp.]|nr:META domain-containing protein [Duncaniella sp.]